MARFELAAVFVALLAAPAALAQESGTGAQADHMAGQQDQTSDLSMLPQGCRDAVQQSDMPEMMPGTDMSGTTGRMEGMDEAQQASMQVMMEMSGPMMAAHSIKDPDLAFNCGMIVHHIGAVAMAEVELKYGADDESKALAQKIIDAQGPEIEQMTAWVEENAASR